jgi:hypothetical protein
MKTIPLSQGKFALVDDEDFDNLNQFLWYASNEHRSWYSARTYINENRHRITLRMHCEIVKEKGWDHIDRDGLNNQRNNLRKASFSDQSVNRKIVPGISGYRGVHPRDGKWRARVCKHGKYTCLGTFETAEQAALAYNEGAKELHGSFAVLNVLS